MAISSTGQRYSGLQGGLRGGLGEADPQFQHGMPDAAGRATTAQTAVANTTGSMDVAEVTGKKKSAGGAIGAGMSGYMAGAELSAKTGLGAEAVAGTTTAAEGVTMGAGGTVAAVTPAAEAAATGIATEVGGVALGGAAGGTGATLTGSAAAGSAAAGAAGGGAGAAGAGGITAAVSNPVGWVVGAGALAAYLLS